MNTNKHNVLFNSSWDSTTFRLGLEDILFMDPLSPMNKVIFLIIKNEKQWNIFSQVVGKTLDAVGFAVKNGPQIVERIFYQESHISNVITATLLDIKLKTAVNIFSVIIVATKFIPSTSVESSSKQMF